ncbi:MAG: hypothetical protein PHV37_04405 [Candidatus Gastranaerophilales bacterium]|nr:hypothetical protein [Candidatus Gastranaerophilales bacterium]
MAFGSRGDDTVVVDVNGERPPNKTTDDAETPQDGGYVFYLQNPVRPQSGPTGGVVNDLDCSKVSYCKCKVCG